MFDNELTLWKVPVDKKYGEQMRNISSIGAEHTCTKKDDASDVGAHLLFNNIFQQLPVHLKGRRSVHCGIRLCLLLSVCMLELPTPHERQLCGLVSLLGWDRVGLEMGTVVVHCPLGCVLSRMSVPDGLVLTAREEGGFFTRDGDEETVERVVVVVVMVVVVVAVAGDRW